MTVLRAAEKQKTKWRGMRPFPYRSQPALGQAVRVAKGGTVGEVKKKPMEATEHHENEKTELRAKLDNAIERAKAACERLQDQTTAAANAADKTVREHPYQAMGLAFGLGILIGVLVSRRND